MDKNGKSRHSVWLSDEVWQEVDAFYKLDNCPTRNEFVEKALRPYCGSLHAEGSGAYLRRALQEMLEGTLGVFGDRLGKLLFKLVVEHNMQILDILDSVTVISFGQKIFEGTPEGMRQDPTVIQTYFGGAV